jgi:hypothetical protein
MLSLDAFTTPKILSLSLLLLTSLLLLYSFLSPTYKFPSNAPPKPSISSFSIVGAFMFFTRRWDFFRHSRDQAKTGNFRFFLGKHPVVGLSGEEGRKVFLVVGSWVCRRGMCCIFYLKKKFGGVG